MTVSEIHKRTVSQDFLSSKERKDLLKDFGNKSIDIRMVNELLYHCEYEKLKDELKGWRVYNPIQKFKEPELTKEFKSDNSSVIDLLLIGTNVFHFIIPYMFLSSCFRIKIIWVKDEQLSLLNNIINSLVVRMIRGEILKRLELDSIKTKAYQNSYVFHKLNFIIDRKFIDKFPRGIINDHWGTLPFYRGRSTFQYQDIFGHPKYITNHLIEAGIDTGKIIAYHKVKTPLHWSKYILLYRRINLSVTRLASGHELIGNDISSGATFYRIHSRLNTLLESL